ncbi:MAG: DNA mismatch repair protein MutL, partial [Synergistaceae bacterium]|nr:DNA mismatch repair protein MutL [Synergistaceae bacterium]
MKITLLPEEVFSRIAAGEVVERPISVVKEAVENSLDGGATEIKVSLFEGGKMRIVVEDNGRGIPFEELPLAAAPHATSKLRTIEELEAVSSLGFRGEALASISAVSRFELRSRAEGEESGGLLKVEGGKQLLHTPIPCRPGTRLSVEDLFYNLPARRKFLKSAAAESRRVFSFLRDMAVAYPGVAFSEESDGKEGFSSTGNGSREDVLRLLWGGEGEIRRCDTASAHLSLESWFLPCPGRSRSTAVTFVNGRSVNDPLLRGAAGSLCRTLVGNWVFFFTLPADLLDVNIHPAKWEIRFRYPGEVYDTVQQAVLNLSGSAPSLAPESFSLRKKRAGIPGQGGPFKGGGSFSSESHRDDAPAESLFGRVSAPPSTLEEGVRTEDSP